MAHYSHQTDLLCIQLSHKPLNSSPVYFILFYCTSKYTELLNGVFHVFYSLICFTFGFGGPFIQHLKVIAPLVVYFPQ